MDINQIEENIRDRLALYSEMKRMEMSEVHAVGDEYMERNFQHNDTKIDALDDRNLDVEASEVERPYMRGEYLRDL